MKLLLEYSIPMRMGSPRGASPLSIKSFPFPYRKGKGIKGIGSPNKILRERGSQAVSEESRR